MSKSEHKRVCIEYRCPVRAELMDQIKAKEETIKILQKECLNLKTLVATRKLEQRNERIADKVIATNDKRISLKTFMARNDYSTKDIADMTDRSTETVRRWASKKEARGIPDRILIELIKN